MNKKDEDLLYRSFTKELAAEEKEKLEQALAASPSLRAEKAELEKISAALSRGATGSFRPGFVLRVWSKTRALASEREDFVGSLSWAFRRIAVATSLVALFVLAHNLYVERSISWQAALRIPQPSIENLWGFEE